MGFQCDYPEVNCERCEEVFEVDGIEPDCGTCDLPFLLPENRDAWELYRTINTRFVYDFHALPLVFNVYGMRCNREEAKGLLDKLILIHGMVAKDARTKQGTHHPGGGR